MVDESLELLTTGECCFLTRDDVVWLLERTSLIGLLLGLVLVFEEPALERLRWVEVNLLRHVGLLILKHLFADISDESQLVHVDLDLVLIVFEAA